MKSKGHKKNKLPVSFAMGGCFRWALGRPLPYIRALCPCVYGPTQHACPKAPCSCINIPSPSACIGITQCTSVNLIQVGPVEYFINISITTPIVPALNNYYT